jgi:hypothetical protein
MNLPLVDHAVLVGALVQIADLRGTHVSETGQPDRATKRVLHR